MTPSQQKLYNRALRFVQKMHHGQVRAGNVPVWHHLARVSHLLGLTLEDAQEGSAKERFTMVLAVLGHDLLEDTKATEEETRAVFGDDGYQLIDGMTNYLGDKNVGPYVRHMAKAPEVVRLIKFADLYDNMTSVTYLLPLLGKKWATSYFLPIVLPMHAAIIKTKFLKYKKTAAQLMAMVIVARKILEEEIRRSR